MAKVCPTLHRDQELITEYVRVGLATPFSSTWCICTTLPTVPWTLLQKLLRSGVHPS